MRTREVGLAVIGCGTIGRGRAVLAREHPAVGDGQIGDVTTAMTRAFMAAWHRWPHCAAPNDARL